VFIRVVIVCDLSGFWLKFMYVQAVVSYFCSIDQLSRVDSSFSSFMPI